MSFYKNYEDLNRAYKTSTAHPRQEWQLCLINELGELLFNNDRRKLAK